jgi:hypothetical protein
MEGIEMFRLKALNFTGTRCSYFWHRPLFGKCHSPFDWYGISPHSLYLRGCKKMIWFTAAYYVDLISCLSGSRYAVQRSGNIFMAFNNKVLDLLNVTRWGEKRNRVSLIYFEYNSFKGSTPQISPPCSNEAILKEPNRLEYAYFSISIFCLPSL